MKTAGYACLIAGVLWLGYVYVGYPVLLALLAIIRRVRHRLEREHTPAISAAKPWCVVLTNLSW